MRKIWKITKYETRYGKWTFSREEETKIKKKREMVIKVY